MRHLRKDRLPSHPSGATYEELHLRNLLVDLLHKLNNEINQLVLQHLLGVEIRDQEGDVVALARRQLHRPDSKPGATSAP